MNQILSVEMPQSRTGGYRNRVSKKADIKTVIIFFCIILILFALILVVIATTMKKQKKEQPTKTPVIAGTQPTINVEIQGETMLNIIVTHDKQIASIAYNWNDGEKIEQTDIGENTKELQIEKPAGTNTLNISVTDINGVIQTYSEQHTGTPVIEGPSLILEEQNGQIKLTAQSNVQIAYISYNWNGGEEKQIEINDVKMEQIIEVPEGENTLNVVLVDANGGETTKSKTIKGDYKPTVKITLASNKTGLIVEANDDEGLTKMTVEVYGTGDIKEYQINGTHCKETIPIQAGENKLIITVYNINGVKNEQRVRVVK